MAGHEQGRDVEDVLGVVPQESVAMSRSCVAGGDIVAPDGVDAGSHLVPEQSELT